MPTTWTRWLAPLGMLLALAVLVPEEVDAQRRRGGRSVSRSGGARGGSIHRPARTHRQRASRTGTRSRTRTSERARTGERARSRERISR